MRSTVALSTIETQAPPGFVTNRFNVSFTDYSVQWNIQYGNRSSDEHQELSEQYTANLTRAFEAYNASNVDISDISFR